jgi:hypothetical protein
MTREAAEQLSRDANSDRTFQRDNAERIWELAYAAKFPRPEGSVNVTQPGA